MENRQIIYIYILIALFTAFIQYLCMKPLLNVQSRILIIDAIVSGVILSGLILLLANISKHSGFSSLSFQQRIINLAALAILFAICWVGGEFLILYITIPTDDLSSLYPTIPFRIAIAILVYSLSIVLFCKKDNAIPEAVLDTDTDTDIENEETTPTQNDESEQIEVLERIAVKNGQKIDVVLVPEIIHLQAEGDYVMIHSTKGKYLKEQTMKSFESSLPPDKFVRVHRSSIINIEFISQIELYNKQSQLLKLKNGSQVKISSSGYKALKRTLGL